MSRFTETRIRNILPSNLRETRKLVTDVDFGGEKKKYQKSEAQASMIVCVNSHYLPGTVAQWPQATISM